MDRRSAKRRFRDQVTRKIRNERTNHHIMNQLMIVGEDENEKKIYRRYKRK